MRKLLHVSVFFLLFFSTQIYAQSRTVSGTVISKDDGLPLPGVSIMVKGTQVGTQTNANGKFSFNVAPAANTLVITYIGYARKEVAIPASNSISITLENDAKSLSEVMVVSPLGLQKQSRESGYSQATIKAAELTQAHPTNLQNGLVGKVSGLNVSTVNNGINADTRIVLRGIRSLTGNNQVLLVVDNVPVPLDYINSINPNDVESVNILKGANASALYGPDGVNGVLLVTTKKGTASKAPEINFSNTYSLEKVAYMPALQHLFGGGSSYNQFGDGVFDPIENQNWGAAFNGQLVNIGRPDENKVYQQVTLEDRSDEKRKFFNTGQNLQTDFSIRSGDANSSYFASFQNVQINGVLPNDKGYRRTFRLNSDRSLGKIVKASTSISYTGRGTNVTTSSANIYNQVINAPAEIPLTSYKDYKNYEWADHNHYYNDYYGNPYEEIDRNRTVTKRDDILGTLNLSITPTKWLQILERPSYQFTTTTSKATVGAIFYSPIGKLVYNGGTDKQASVTDGNRFLSRFQNELIITANKKFGDFGLKFIGDNTIRENYNKFSSQTGNTLGVPTLFNSSVYTGIPGIGEADYRTRLFSLAGDLELSYKNFAFIEFTGRNDWDSRLNVNRNSYFYPGVSGSLVLSDVIPAIKDNKQIDLLKLRLSYNKTGNVNTGGIADLLGAYRLESTYSNSGGFPYGTNASYSADGTLYDPNLRPETVESFEGGLEVGFLNNRILIDGSYYFQKNNNQVINISVSQGTGYSSVFLNAADFDNKGFDIDLKLVPVRSGKVVWNLNTTYSFNDTKVNSLYQGVPQLAVANTAYVIVGYPAYTHRIIDWLRDSEGRVIVDPLTGLPTRNSASTIFGRINPKNIFSINTDVSYKHFTLRAVAEYRGGNYIYNDIGSSL
ncbi:MAG: SusC/RagA family TonB-linked outer membrane protein, partial [Sphingobacteriaceae bacterium]